MSQVITNAFEQYWQSSLAAEQPVVLDEFILADIPNLDITSPIDPDTGLPPESQIVHRQNVDQRGRINNNAVAYTIVMDTTVGDFSFNAMYLRNKQNGVIGMIVYKGRETKLKTDQTTGQTGNSLVKSMLMGYDQAAEATLTHVDAGTWQIDYAARLRGQDEDLRQLASQLYGHHTFIGDGFKVVQHDGGHQITQGVAIVGGLRIELKQPEVIYPGTKPIGVWVDVHRSGSLLSEHQNHFTIITSVADLTDHVDSNGYPHYVAKLGTVQADGTIEDGRGVSGGSAGETKEELEKNRVNSREAIRRTYALLGLYLVDGSFEEGGVLASPRDVLLHEKSGKAYSWAGGYPEGGYVVDKGTNPSTSTAFVNRSTAKADYDSVKVMFAESVTSFFVGQRCKTGGTTWIFEDKGSDITAENFRAFGALCALDWGVKPNDPEFDNSPLIIEMLSYASSKVIKKSGYDSRGGLEVAFTEGVYRVDSMMRFGNYNLGIAGYGGVTFEVSNWGDLSVNPAVFLVGSAEDWLSTDTISTTHKYNYIRNIKLSKTTDINPIAIMLSGTRNAMISNILAERFWCGLWCENTSELTSHQFSSIGCTYGIIGDSRKERSKSQSPLGVANVDNDVSSNIFNGTTVYYPQHTGILLINTGTTSFYSCTMGRFSENPSPGNGLRYGLTGKKAGVHYWGANLNFTKSGILEDFVFEASPDSSKTCILVTSESASNPVRGLTMNNMHVQTYAADYENGNVTTLLQVESYLGGGVDAVTLRDSGFTFATAGYKYPRLVWQTKDDDVGSAVMDMSVKLENCYPTVSLSTSNIGKSVVNNIEYIERVNTEVERETSGAPKGWLISSGATLKNLAGASGEEGYIRLSGADGLASHIYKEFKFRYFQSRLGAVYLSLWYRGDSNPHINFIVNGVPDTARVIKSGQNKARYSNALEDFEKSSKWRRAVYMFRPFAANYAFDTLRVELGRIADGVDNYTEIKSIDIGFSNIIEEPYNTF